MMMKILPKYNYDNVRNSFRDILEFNFKYFFLPFQWNPQKQIFEPVTSKTRLAAFSFKLLITILYYLYQLSNLHLDFIRKKSTAKLSSTIVIDFFWLLYAQMWFFFHLLLLLRKDGFLNAINAMLHLKNVGRRKRFWCTNISNWYTLISQSNLIYSHQPSHRQLASLPGQIRTADLRNILYTYQRIQCRGALDALCQGPKSASVPLSHHSQWTEALSPHLVGFFHYRSFVCVSVPFCVCNLAVYVLDVSIDCWSWTSKTDVSEYSSNLRPTKLYSIMNTFFRSRVKSHSSDQNLASIAKDFNKIRILNVWYNVECSTIVSNFNVVIMVFHSLIIFVVVRLYEDLPLPVLMVFGFWVFGLVPYVMSVIAVYTGPTNLSHTFMNLLRNSERSSARRRRLAYLRPIVIGSGSDYRRNSGSVLLLCTCKCSKGLLLMWW